MLQPSAILPPSYLDELDDEDEDDEDDDEDDEDNDEDDDDDGIYIEVWCDSL